MFKDRLKELRLQKGLTQEELAQKIYVSRSAICKWEMGNGLPSEANIEGLCLFFNVTEEWLLDRNDLKEYIKKEEKLKIKNLIISIIGLIIAILCVIFTFVRIFKPVYNNPNTTAYLLLFVPPKSIYDFMGAGVIIPIVFYSITFACSFINIFQLIKVELARKMLIGNTLLVIVSLLLFVTTFIIAILLANEKSFGIF